MVILKEILVPEERFL